MGALQQTKFSDRTSATVIEALGRGHSIRKAAAFAGVSHPTVLSWMKTHPDFQVECEQAKAEYLDGLVKIVTKAAETDPRLAARILEAKDPDGWAPKSRHEVTGDGGGAVTHEVTIRWPAGPVPPAQSVVEWEQPQALPAAEAS